MTCDDFKAYTKRHPLSLTIAEHSAIRSHVRSCEDCRLLIFKWTFEAKLRGDQHKEEQKPIINYINARVDADPEAKPVKVISVKVSV